MCAGDVHSPAAGAGATGGRFSLRVCCRKGHTPHRDKGDVTWDAPPGLPCAAPLVESRNGTRGTKPPRPAASTQLWELVCRPRKFCPMQTKTLYQPTTSNTVFEGGTQPVGAPNSLGFQSPRIAYTQ